MRIPDFGLLRYAKLETIRTNGVEEYKQEVVGIIEIKPHSMGNHFSVSTKEDVGSPKEEDEDNSNHKPSSDDKLPRAIDDSSEEAISEGSKIGASSPDELDIVDKPEDPSLDKTEGMKRQIKNADNEGNLYYELGTERGEVGLKRRIDAIRNLNCCKELTIAKNVRSI
ncbi:hypothetical protein ACEPAG_3818 [Sanghuangporus baumii]